MNNRTLGTLAMAGAPFLLLFTSLPHYLPEYKNTFILGVFGIIYLSAWVCSIVGLYRLEATGSGRFGKGLLLFTLFTLNFVHLLGLMETMAPKANPLLLQVLDTFWPVSHLAMLLVGIAVAVQGRLRGWQRYVPLAVGLWLPFAMGAVIVLDWAPEAELLGGLYSAAAWMALGFVVRSSSPEEVVYPVRGILLSRG